MIYLSLQLEELIFLTLLAITLIKQSLFFFFNVYVSGSLDFSNKVVLCRMCSWGMLYVCANLVISMVWT